MVGKPKPLSRDRTITPAERQLILSAIRGPAFRRFVTALNRPEITSAKKAVEILQAFDLYLLPPKIVAGPAEFLDFLGELSAHLESPLVILSLEQEGREISAHVWIVRPSADSVEEVSLSLPDFPPA